MILFLPKNIKAGLKDKAFGYETDDVVCVVDSLNCQNAKSLGSLNSVIKRSSKIWLYSPESISAAQRLHPVFNVAYGEMAQKRQLLKSTDDYQHPFLRVRDDYNAQMNKIGRLLLDPKAGFSPIFEVGAGIIIGGIIISNAGSIASTLHDVHTLINRDALPSFIRWIMGYPAGLKLNSFMTKFTGELHLWLLSFWNDLLETNIIGNAEMITTCIGVSGILGIRTLIITMAFILRLLCIHWEAFFILSSRLYTASYMILGSLWRLFLGKKWNVLHCRVDSAEYSLDQLLLGTVMFTVITFLMPTILVYYLLFSALSVVRHLLRLTLNLILLQANPQESQPCSVYLKPAKIYSKEAYIIEECREGSSVTCLLSNFSRMISFHLGWSFWASLRKGWSKIE